MPDGSLNDALSVAGVGAFAAVTFGLFGSMLLGVIDQVWRGLGWGR